MSSLPACGHCGKALHSQGYALEHLRESHGLTRSEVIQDLEQMDWPDENEASDSAPSRPDSGGDDGD